jgi:hypothetical protein
MMLWKFRRLGNAVWQYLSQSLFSAQSPALWRPSQFWYAYRIRILEACWLKKSAAQSHSQP